jgi:hypothetical protein
METIEINFRGVEMTVEYEAYETDYGVEGSPVWDQCDINSVTVGNAHYRTELIEMLDEKQMEAISEQILEALND